MEIELNFDDMVSIFKGFGCENKKAETLADYINQCCSKGWNIREWYYNTSGMYFENKEKALKYINDNNLEIEKDCNIYESFNGGIWFEYY